MLSSLRYVILEGIDGCGKDTIARVLKHQGWTVVTQPSKTWLGNLARETQWQFLFKLDLFLHDYKLRRILRKNKQRVVGVREVLSQVAYGGMRYWKAFDKRVKQLDRLTDRNWLIIVLDVSVDEAITRIERRGLPEKPNRTELARVSQVYRELVKKLGAARAVLVNGNGTIEEVTLRVQDALDCTRWH